MTSQHLVGPKAYVLGHPIKHSKSPTLHKAAYEALGEQLAYERRDTQVADLQQVFAEYSPQSGARGFSVTMPLKSAVLPYLDELTPFARAVGVVNTVYWQQVEGGYQAWGHNTDVSGIVNALRQAGLSGKIESAAIVGGGGTATAALTACAYLGVGQVSVYVRNEARAQTVKDAAARLSLPLVFERLEDFSADAHRYEVVVSTLPAGAADDLLPERGEALGVLLDVTYDPWPSVLADRWAGRGGAVTSGLEMLMYQAVDQVKLFMGRNLDQELPQQNQVLAAMRTAVGLPVTGYTPELVSDPKALSNSEPQRAQR